MTYLNDDQLAQLLRPINPVRVNKDGKGFSHVEAYDIRAHLNRIFGFGRWSQTTAAMELIFETAGTAQDGKPNGKTTVAYRAQVTLTVCALDGTPLATYTEWAMGSAQNQPSRADAHDLAMKTAESQALKRAAANLGDNFGLSLYAKGSLAPVVRKTLIKADAKPAEQGIDDDTEQLPAESTAPDPADEPRTTTAPPVETPEKAEQIRAALLAGPGGLDPRKWLQDLTREAAQAKVLSAKVLDVNGKPVALKVLLESELKFRTAA